MTLTHLAWTVALLFVAFPTLAQTPATAEQELVAVMLQHHRDGAEMARMGEKKATRPGVKALARRIRESSERAARALEPFRPSHPSAVDTTIASRQTEHGMDHYTGLHEVKNALERVRAASGPQADAVFVTEMAKHHERTIQLTGAAALKTPQLRKLTAGIAAGQRKELAELKQLP
jgi:uncharacterized protein (DUF305 family)